MAEKFKRAAAWLGLVTDDRYLDEDAEPTEGVGREELLAGAGYGGRDSGNGYQPQPEPSSVTHLESKRSEQGDVRSWAGGGGVATAAAVSAAPQAAEADLSRIVTVHPRTFNDARTIGEHFRDGVPVIMNVSQMENPDAKRLVDFAAGLILGLRGNIERVTSKVFLLSPYNINVTAEDKERIAGGFFNQS
jgi:cell division inhibitor SepF